jgi:hypothetical protein
MDLQAWKARHLGGSLYAFKVCGFSEGGAFATALPYFCLSQAPQEIEDGF